MKLQYALMDREIDNTYSKLTSLKLSDDARYRPILGMDSIPESYRIGAVGGVERFPELRGYPNSDFLISYKAKLEEIKNMANVQSESYSDVMEKAIQWRRQVDHFPGISPVSVKFRLGDGYVFRTVHPVLGIGRMHNGQDFEVPYGTDVHATGDGVVEECGWDRGGFGKFVVIDHDYGLQTLYGHLSEIKVTQGMNVKRGDIIGISGSTGLSSGPHLHYQVEERGKAINPVKFLNNDMTLEEYNEMIQAFDSKSRFR
jgi:murein DD-endopeptidase MepM/ murein hydrolase activator NlpD